MPREWILCPLASSVWCNWVWQPRRLWETPARWFAAKTPANQFHKVHQLPKRRTQNCRCWKSADVRQLGYKRTLATSTQDTLSDNSTSTIKWTTNKNLNKNQFLHFFIKHVLLQLSLSLFAKIYFLQHFLMITNFISWHWSLDMPGRRERNASMPEAGKLILQPQT